MLESYLNSPVTRRRLRTGLAADHIDAFADWLHLKGYRPTSINSLLRSLAGWTDWMLAAGFSAQDLRAGVEACKLALKQKQRVRFSRGPNDYSVTAASVFIRFLHGIYRAKSIVVAVRSFVRFLGVTGRCAPDMEHAIPGFASRQLVSAPRFLCAEEVERVISSCNNHLFGLRDRAVLRSQFATIIDRAF
jgi:site-specific recombinase XerD